MANAFDQFDQPVQAAQPPQANSFDQFDAPPPPQVAQTAEIPPSGYFLAKAGVPPAEAVAAAPLPAPAIPEPITEAAAGALRGARELLPATPTSLAQVPQTLTQLLGMVPIKPPEISDILREAPLQIAQKAAELRAFPEAPVGEKARTIAKESLPALLGILGVREGIRAAEVPPPIEPVPVPPPVEAPPVQTGRFTLVPTAPEPAPVVQPPPPLAPVLERLGQREFGKVTAEGVVPPPPPAEPLPAETAVIQPRGGELSATQERQITEGLPIQRPGDVQGRPPVEAGVGGGVQPAAEIGRPPAPEEAPVAPPEPAGEVAKPAVQPETPLKRPISGVSNKAFSTIYGEGAIPTGTGQSAEQWISYGKEQLPNADVPAIITKARANSNLVTPGDYSVLRAEHERLLTEARAAEDTARANPTPENLRAWNDKSADASDFAKGVMQPFKQNPSDLFRAMQQTTELPMDRITDYQQMFQERLRRDMTPDESARATRMADETKANNAQYEAANGDVLKTLDTEYGRIRTVRQIKTLDDLKAVFGEPLEEVC